MSGNQKKSLGATSGLINLTGQKGADLSRNARTRIAMLNNASSFLFRFSNFYKEIVVYDSELIVQRYSSGIVAT